MSNRVLALTTSLRESEPESEFCPFVTNKTEHRTGLEGVDDKIFIHFGPVWNFFGIIFDPCLTFFWVLCNGKRCSRSFCGPRFCYAFGNRCYTFANKQHYSELSGFFWRNPEFGTLNWRLLGLLPGMPNNRVAPDTQTDDQKGITNSPTRPASTQTMAWVGGHYVLSACCVPS